MLLEVLLSTPPLPRLVVSVLVTTIVHSSAGPWQVRKGPFSDDFTRQRDVRTPDVALRDKTFPPPQQVMTALKGHKSDMMPIRVIMMYTEAFGAGHYWTLYHSIAPIVLYIIGLLNNNALHYLLEEWKGRRGTSWASWPENTRKTLSRRLWSAWHECTFCSLSSKVYSFVQNIYMTDGNTILRFVLKK
jgi:hypothetical protein